jgi:hypothetical protein
MQTVTMDQHGPVGISTGWAEVISFAREFPI